MRWNEKESERRLTGGQSLQDAGSTCYRLQGCYDYHPHQGWLESFAWWHWRWALMDGHSWAELWLELSMKEDRGVNHYQKKSEPNNKGKLVV